MNFGQKLMRPRKKQGLSREEPAGDGHKPGGQSAENIRFRQKFVLKGKGFYHSLSDF